MISPTKAREIVWCYHPFRRSNKESICQQDIPLHSERDDIAVHFIVGEPGDSLVGIP